MSEQNNVWFRNMIESLSLYPNEDTYSAFENFVLRIIEFSVKFVNSHLTNSGNVLP